MVGVFDPLANVRQAAAADKENKDLAAKVKAEVSVLQKAKDEVLKAEDGCVTPIQAYLLLIYPDPSPPPPSRRSPGIVVTWPSRRSLQGSLDRGHQAQCPGAD